MINKNYSNWICFQIGAREHYAIPRILKQKQQLYCLVTDSWITPRSPLNLLPNSILSSLRERYNVQLSSASICSFNSSLIKFEIKQKFKNRSSWQTIIDRNYWFQQQSLEFLKSIVNYINKPVTIFAYSYAALEILKFAKDRGWQTILGQIDPGIYEEQLVQKENNLYLQYADNWQPAPTQYWTDWQQECLLADKIVVNSEWSSKALQKTGIPSYKIATVPLAYKTPPTAKNFAKFYPKSFSGKRPLRVLFLGQIILRKGIARILEAIELLKNEAIEFWFVGSIQVKLPREIKNNPQIKWFGSVSRSTTVSYYQQADVFLFPTLSDGFGLTQLEAQAWRLPIIASHYCGAVVKDGVNGLLLTEVTDKAIADSLLFCLHNPDLLQQFSQKSEDIITNFSLEKLGNKLQIVNETKFKISQ